MLESMIKEENIRLQVKARDWKEALYLGVKLLVDQDSVEPRYYDAILQYFESYGPYMVIAPGVVLAHGRPSDGVKEVGISLMTLEEPIVFGHAENDPVKLVITLAALDTTSHLIALEELSEFLMSDGDLEAVCEAKDKESIKSILKKYIKKV